MFNSAPDIVLCQPEGPPALSCCFIPSGLGDIALCTAPIHGGDFQAAAIPEWLEFNKLMGVATVFAYDMSAGPVTQALLAR